MSRGTNGRPAAEELADRIRATATTKQPVETALTTDQRVLARITDGIYRQPASALRELISNAYDADATQVHILTDAPRFSQISIRDDGAGLSPETLQHMVQHIGGSAKRTHSGVELNVTAANDVNRSPGGRQLIGKLGIGLFSVAQFTRHFLIITKTKGERFRTVADITLGPVNQEQLLAEPISTAEKRAIQTGHARIWQEKERDTTSHGTEIKLLDLLPRTRAELASLDLWARIDYETETEGRQLTRTPSFHIGRVNPENRDEILIKPELPWSPSDKPLARFRKLVDGVRSLADTDKDLIDLDAVCDRYLQTIWTLALAAPVQYIERHPFDLVQSDDISFFRLENQTKGQAKLIDVDRNKSPRKLLDMKTPQIRKDDHFDVFVDGIHLQRPIVFLNQPETDNSVKHPLLFIGKCREEFAKKPVELSGGPLDFEAYLFWTPKVVPTEHQGVIVRVGNASGAPFDRTFMGYQVSEQTRLRQIVAEIFVLEGLDGAINLDRESFNYAHPHYQFLVKWLHSALRQLTNRHKELGKAKREERRALGNKKAKEELDNIVERNLRERGIEDIPDVQIIEPSREAEAVGLRRKGAVVLRREQVLPQKGDRDRASEVDKKRASLTERKAIAIAQILNAWQLVDHLSFEDQERLIRDILEAATLDVER